MIKKQPSSDKRFYELDYLRGIAALSVVLFHFTYGYDYGLGIINSNKFYFTYGKLGVNLFFMISGYVIFMTLNNVQQPLDFIVSRFARLYPAYWCAIIFSIIFVNIFDNPFEYEKVSIKQILLNFTMLQHWFKVKDIDGAYWTLSVELTFYIIMFTLYILDQLKKIELYCLGWLILTYLCVSFKIPFENYLNELFILKYSPLFIAGILLFRFKVHGNSVLRYTLLLLSLIVEISILYSINSDWITVTIIISFYIILLAFVKDKIYIKKNRALLFFGTISYSLYLIHENIGLTIIYNLKNIFDFQPFYIITSFVIVVAIASLITYTIERPVMDKIKIYYKNNSKKVALRKTQPV